MSGHLTPTLTLDTHHDHDTTRGRQLGQLVSALDHTFDQHHPDAVLVQGVTTSALASALATSWSDWRETPVSGGVTAGGIGDPCAVSTPSDRQSRRSSGEERVDPAPRPSRRVFTAGYKLAMVAEYENAPNGEKGAIPRSRQSRGLMRGDLR